MALIAIAVVTIAPARAAVADWLGIGSTSVDIRDDLPPASTAAPPPRSDDPLDVIQAEASAQLGVVVRLPIDNQLGTPSGWEVRDLARGDELVVVWDDVRLTAWPADANQAPLLKVVPTGQTVDSAIEAAGDPALWIEGAHVRVGESRTLVPSTLLWVREGVEYHLSGPNLRLDRAIEIAGSQE